MGQGYKAAKFDILIISDGRFSKIQSQLLVVNVARYSVTVQLECINLSLRIEYTYLHVLTHGVT